MRAGIEGVLAEVLVDEGDFVEAVAAAALVPEGGYRDARVVRVSVRVGNPDGLLRPNQTGYASIDCGERRVPDVLTRRPRRFVRPEMGSWRRASFPSPG